MPTDKEAPRVFASMMRAGFPDLQATIEDVVQEGETIVVRASGVSEPAAVRFGWRHDAVHNLMNKEGLPASAFRTDDWPGSTYDKK